MTCAACLCPGHGLRLCAAQVIDAQNEGQQCLSTAVFAGAVCRVRPRLHFHLLLFALSEGAVTNVSQAFQQPATGIKYHS